jgi:hypothetical protein
MSAVSQPIPISRTQLFAAVIVTMALSGAGFGVVSDGFLDGGDPSPPGSTGDAAVASASIEITASDPPNVRDSAGEVGHVTGSLDGVLEVSRDVDRVTFVVWSRLPNGSWAVVDRTSIESLSNERVDIGESVGGPNATYLRDDHSSGFDLDEPGSTARRSGYVSVTARLYAGGELETTVTDTDGYAFLIDRPAARTVGSDGSRSTAGEGAASGTESTPSGEMTSGQDSSGPDSSSGSDSTNGQDTAGGNSGADGRSDAAGDAPATDPNEAEPNRTTALFGTDDAVPGSSGSGTVQLSNPDDGPVTAEFAIGAPIDEENGLTEPEKAVDDTPDTGELSSHLDVRIAVERGGERTDLVGGDGEFVPLADAAASTRSLDLDPDETVTVTVEWRIARDVGNEIQSDRTTLSVHCEFSSSSTLLESPSLF